jgi:hypothetical protein
MANIYGDYKVLGDLYIEAPNQQPYPLLLSTDNEGKVLFVESVNSITASVPISAVINAGTVSITHDSSGWSNKTSLTGLTVISNLDVSPEGHIIDWETRQLTINDTFNVGIGLSIDGNTIKFGDGQTLSYIDTPTIKDFFLYQTSPTLLSKLYSRFGATSPTLAEAGFAVTNNSNRGSEIKVEYNSSSPNALVRINVDGATGSNVLTIDELDGYLLRDDIKQRGFVNFGDYESNFIPRSLVTKQYVDNNFVTLGTTQSIAGQKTFTNSVTAANFITTSDITLKTDIKPIENALDKLEKFTSYEYIKNGLKEAGFIAQEVREVLPYTVFENEGILTMSDRPVLAYLHSAVLELKNEINKIKK